MKNINHSESKTRQNNSNGQVKLVMYVLASQMLLLALTVAWFIHMALIAQNGQIIFNEPSSTVLAAEIITLAVIASFSITVFVLQIKSYFNQTSRVATTEV